jgi:glutamyl-tRNA reductase
MPPDVEAAVGELAHVTLVDIAALGRHLAEQHVPDEVPRVRAIVAEEVARHLRGQHGAAAAPVIGAMHTRIEELAQAELRRLQGRLAGLSEEQRSETSATVHRILRTFLHGPSVRARQLSTEPDGWVYVEALRRLFDPGVSEAALDAAGRTPAG